MHFVTVFAAEEAPQFDPDKVTPGVLGFAAIALVAVAVIFLLLDMNRRIRRIRYREEVREQLALEIAERDAAAAESDAEGADPADASPADADSAVAEATADADAADAEATADDAESDPNQPGNAGR